MSGVETADSDVRIGIDIGGTFTDFLLVDSVTGSFAVHKALTTPHDPSLAVLDGLRTLLGSTGVAPSAVTQIVHGTTLVTNALIERKGAVTGLLTTKGFRDAVEIGREHRYDLYDLFIDLPEPLVPRYLRLEIDERVLSDGSIHRQVTESDVRERIDQLRAEGVEAVAVSLLHSYQNPEPERQVGRILEDYAPDLVVSLSSDVVPEIREFERTSTTIANVYTRPVVAEYLDRLVRSLRELGITAPLLRDDLLRWAEHGRNRAPLPDPARRVGTGRRRAGRRLPRQGVRPVVAALLRHGRDDRQGLPDRRQPAVDLARVRGQSRLPVQEGQRPAGPGAGDRADRDRRGRRQHCPGRCDGPAQGRTG